MGKNQPCKNILKDGKQIVFEEINKWLRNISNTIWMVISFFLSLNLLLMRSAFSTPISEFIENNSFSRNLFLIRIVFCGLWIVPGIFALVLIAISEKLVDLMNNDSLEIKEFISAIKFEFPRDIIKVFLALRFPFGWIIVTLTLLLYFAWRWVIITLN